MSPLTIGPAMAISHRRSIVDHVKDLWVALKTLTLHHCLSNYLFMKPNYFIYLFIYSYKKESESYEIDIDHLDTIEQVETPLCSASRLKVFEDDIKMSPMSVSPTNMSVSQDDSTLSR